MTTLEDVVLTAVNVTITVKGFALDGKTEKAVAAGTVITFTGAYGTYSYKMGEAAPAQMLADTYIVTADGYAVATLVVPREGGALTLTLKEAITIGKGATELTGNAWNGNQKVDLPEGLTAGDFVFEATLKMRDFTEGWNTLGTQQRYAIRLTEGNVGFVFWSWSADGDKTNIRQFGENNINNAMAENDFVNNKELENGYIKRALLSEDGLRLRITRTGTTFTLEVMNGEEWATLGSVTCEESDAADIELYAGAGNFEWSSITVTPNVQE